MSRPSWTKCKIRFRLGTVSKQLPRFAAHYERIADERKLAKLLLETGEAAPPKSTTGVTSGGDERRLRGLPAIGRGVSGAIPGSSPHLAAIANEMRVSKMGVKRRR